MEDIDMKRRFSEEIPSEKIKAFVTIETKDGLTLGCMGNGKKLPVAHALIYSTDLALNQDERMDYDVLSAEDIQVKVQILGDGYDIFSNDDDNLKIEEFLQSITPQDYDDFGVIVELKTGGSATYLPQVSSIPHFKSINHVFQSLVQKAGGKGRMEEIQKIKFYNLLYKKLEEKVEWKKYRKSSF